MSNKPQRWSDRNSNKPQSRKSERPQRGTAGWRGQRGKAEKSSFTFFRWKQSGEDARLSYYVQLFLGFVAVAGLAYALLLVIWPRDRKTPFVGLAITKYDDALIGPNSYAYEDQKQFQQFWPRSQANLTGLGRAGVVFHGNAENKRYETKQLSNYLRTALSETQPGGPDEDAVMIYLSAHGIVDEDGSPYLLLSDSDPWDKSTWFSMATVIETLVSDEVSASLGSAKIILFLDCNRRLQNFRGGQLYNSFAIGLEQVIKEYGRDNLVVINSTSPEQVNWFAPEEGGTVFGHFLARGINGEAESSEDQDTDIRLGELFDYLDSKINNWSQLKRAQMLRPRVLTLGDDTGWREWGVCKATSNSGETARPDGKVPSAVSERAHKLETLWADLDNATWPADVTTKYPVELAVLQFRLTRLEQLLLAGEAYRVDFDNLVNTMLSITAADSAEEILQQLRNDETIVQPPGLNTAFITNSNSRASVNQFYEIWRNSPEAKKCAPESYEVAAAAGLRWLTDDLKGQQFSSWSELQSQSDQLLQFLGGVSNAEGTAARRQEPDFVEVQFLRLLNRWLDPGTPPNLVLEALHARRIAEEAATPRDIRAHYWIQQLINRGDQQRREADDALFLGTDRFLGMAQEQWRQLVSAQGAYSAALARGDTVAQAYRIRDFAHTVWPVLVDWQLRKGIVAGEPLTKANLTDLNQTTTALNRLASKLDERFDPQLELDEKEIDEIAELEEKVRQELVRHAGELQTAWNNVDTASTQLAILPWLTLLETPFLELTVPLSAADLQQDSESFELSAASAEERNILRRKLLDVIFGRDTTVKSDPPKDVAVDQILTLLNSVDQHPMASLMLTRTGGTVQPLDATLVKNSDPLKQICGQSQQLRSNLLESRNRFRDLTLTPDGEPSQSGRKLRGELADADRLIRASAAFQGDAQLSSNGSRLTQGLQDLDRKFLLLWHTHRVLQDFWASADDVELPYFELASQYLIEAQGLQKYTRYQKDDVLEELDRLKRSREAFVNAREDTPQKVSETSAERFAARLDLYTGERVPEGTVALFGRLREDSENVPLSLNRQGPQTRSPVLTTDLAKSSEVIDVEFQAVGGTTLDVLALFRGHVRKSQLVLANPEQGELRDDLERRRNLPGKVLVDHTDKRKVHVTLVLDASLSMLKNDMQYEGRAITRIAAAKKALEEVLLTLRGLQAQKYEVSLFVYGHRAGPNAQEVDLVQYTEEYKKKVKSGLEPQLHPNGDIQSLFKRQNLNGNLIQAVVNQIRELKARGGTPLYYAMYQALRELRDTSHDVDNQVIVITDGANALMTKFQRDNAVGPLAARLLADFDNKEGFVWRNHKDATTLNSLIEELDRTGVPVNINVIKVRMTDEIPVKNAQFFDVDSQLADLTDRIRRSLGLDQCDVTNVDEGTTDRITVGKTWTSRELNLQRTPFDVQLKRQSRVPVHPVELEGGEFLRLRYNPRSNRLEHYRYVESKITDRRADCSGHYVSVLYPKRRGENMLFRVSLQNIVETEFSKRPVGVWARIRPTGYPSNRRPKKPKIYHFSDMRFEKDRPVPVLEFTARDWPDDAVEAEIEIWFRHGTDITPDHEAAVDEEVLKFASMPGVLFETERGTDDTGRFEIFTVRELYENKELEDLFQQARVKLVPEPNRVVRKLLPETGGVLHEFWYLGSNKPKVMSITSRKRMQESYVGLDRPVLITLPER